jgi:cytochrome c peroxidase
MQRPFVKWSALVALAVTFVACTDKAIPTAVDPLSTTARYAKTTDIDPAVVAIVRSLAAGRGIGRLQRPPRVRPELVKLGEALIFDPILSGNKNISCMTCHLPGFGTGDGKMLSVGEGGTDFGPARTHPSGVFIPRNAPPLFNLASMRRLFWDGRIQMQNGQVLTPAGAHVTAEMQRVFEFGPVSALPMFPVTNRAEMRGLPTSGNELAALADDDFTGIWRALMRRLGNIPQYRELFEAAYRGQRFDNMTFAHASNAIGGFIVEKLSFNDTPWDRFLAGDDFALSARQLEGAKTFLTLKCSICHTGATLSDQEFHNVAVAQIGPGQGDGAGSDDFGRIRVTGNADDRYRFRTTPLRNVELTGPYGHDGSIVSLRDFVAHYSESHLKLLNFDPQTLEPALRGTLVPNANLIVAQRDTLLEGVVFDSAIVDKLVDYMQALTDEAARDLTQLTPSRVPSKLKVEPGRK